SAIEAQKEAHPMILGRPGVIGIGASTDDDGAPVVVVFMTDSAQVGKLPRRVRGVPVVVEVVDRPVIAAQPEGKSDGKPGNVPELPPQSAAPNHSPNRSPALPSPAPVEDACTVSDRTTRFERPVPIGVSAGIAGFSGGTY